MLSCSIWFFAPSFWMGGGPESRSVGRVYGTDVAVSTTLTAPYTRPTQRLSRSPPIQKLGAENISCNSTSNAPDDGRTYQKHVELRIRQ